MVVGGGGGFGRATGTVGFRTIFGSACADADAVGMGDSTGAVSPGAVSTGTGMGAVSGGAVRDVAWR